MQSISQFLCDKLFILLRYDTMRYDNEFFFFYIV